MIEVLDTSNHIKDYSFNSQSYLDDAKDYTRINFYFTVKLFSTWIQIPEDSTEK